MSVFQPAGVDVLFDVNAPMRDGVRLSCDIFFPRGQRGPFPAILRRTPYDNATASITADACYFAQHGYAVVVQDCRGRFDSEGTYSPWVHGAIFLDEKLVANLATQRTGALGPNHLGYHQPLPQHLRPLDNEDHGHRHDKDRTDPYKRSKDRSHWAPPPSYSRPSPTPENTSPHDAVAPCGLIQRLYFVPAVRVMR